MFIKKKKKITLSNGAKNVYKNILHYALLYEDFKISLPPPPPPEKHTLKVTKMIIKTKHILKIQVGNK